MIFLCLENINVLLGENYTVISMHKKKLSVEVL